MRRYLIIPHGAALLEVRASSPWAALHKAERGKAEAVDVDGGLAVAASRTTHHEAGHARIQGQLDLYGNEH